MAWVVLFIVFWLLALLLVPGREWRRLWPAGIIGFITVYVIDSTFIGLGAFSYSQSSLGLSGLPIFYHLSVIAGAVLLVYYYPSTPWKQILYVMLTALVFLLIENVLIRLNYFHHLSWSLARSYVLNLVGFISVLWLAQKVNAVGKKDSSGEQLST